MTKCRKCLVPENVPGAKLDSNGVCAFCRAQPSNDRHADEEARLARERDLEMALTSCRGQSEYDAVVCLSGGKDSIYLLHRLKVEYGLKVLAFTTDVNIPDVAWKNIRRTIKELQVDHLVYRPPDAFYRKLFRYLLQNQEARGAVYTVSYVYAPLFEGDALKVAMEKGIPLVVAGYSPGQPEPERMVYEFSEEMIKRTDWTPPELRRCGQFDESELARFWNPRQYPAGAKFPRYLAPFHAWKYDQDRIMKEVVRLGLVSNMRHASPVFSNYPVQWLLMYSDLKHFGYNPYAPEFSTLIREGKASLPYWRIMGPVVDFMIRSKMLLGRNVTSHLQWLELSAADLRIARARGAYDPEVLGISAPPHPDVCRGAGGAL
ncbi:MAG: hypothetical protein C0404_07060 [Verrucomicrobia bacterium]|nr:hypothetical protein [Verrucomicrobiota bacterium]